jgi:MinD-like ATPase involved in chromosome partitioning or flagellar assembly
MSRPPGPGWGHQPQGRPAAPGDQTQRVVTRGPAHPPVPTPPQARPTQTVGDATRFVGRIDKGDALPRRVWRVASRFVTSNRASVDLTHAVAATQVPLTTGRRIAVTSVRGGAGKSAISAVLASIFAARRADPVLAADADPDGGSLAWRLGVPVGQGVTLSALAPSLLTARGGMVGDLGQLLPRTATGLWVLPGGAPRQPELCRDVTRALSRLFGVCVTDCGQGVDSPAAAAVLSEAHAIVLVAPATADGVRSTCALLARYAGPVPGQRLGRVVVALNTQSPAARHGLKESEARKVIEWFGVPVVRLPYDRHLAAGGPITPAAIGEDTLVAAVRLAGLTLARAQPL